jgi:hypothetical protein
MRADFGNIIDDAFNALKRQALAKRAGMSGLAAGLFAAARFGRRR